MASYTYNENEKVNLLFDSFPSKKELDFFLYLMHDMPFRIILDRKQILCFEYLFRGVSDFLGLELHILQRIINEANSILPTMHPEDKKGVIQYSKRELKRLNT